MLIFVIPTSYPNENNPVANCFIEEQMRYLSADKDNNYIILNVQKQSTSTLFKRIDKNIYEDHKDYDINLIHTKSKTVVESKFPLLNYFIFTNSLRKLYFYAIKKYGVPDLIYAHFYNAACSAYSIVGKSIPIVTMEHSGEIMEKNISFTKKMLLRKAVKISKCYIASTKQLQTNILKLTKANNIDVIPNLIDDKFSYCDPPKDYFHFFSLARLEFDKRIDLLINSFCDSFSSEEDVKLYIGGEGKEKDNLCKLIRFKKREHQIIMLGRLSRLQVVENMKKCSCFVLPSRHETFGMVWREALCIGRPVITTNHGGFCSDDWSEQFGIMIPIDDKKALCEALLYMKNNYNDYDCLKISQLNKKLYSSDIVCLKLKSIFEKVKGN